MLRAALACVLTAVAVTSGTPATAAASPYVVYEAYPVKKNGPKEVPIRFYGMHGGPDVIAMLDLAPDEFDGGYSSQGTSMAYTSGGSFSTGLWSFRDVPGQRHLFAAPRGTVRFLSLSGYWRVRATSLGFRTYGPQHGAIDRDVAGTNLDHFHSASAPSGKYGSTVRVQVPCASGAGTWTLAAGSEQVDNGTCVLNDAFAYHDTHGAGPWTLTGPVIGNSTYRFRFVVWDHPKR